MELEDIRKENLSLLIEKYGTIAELNSATGRTRNDPTYSMLRNGTKRSNGKPRIMGRKFAKRMESLLGLPNLWFEQRHFGRVEEAYGDFVPVPELAQWASMGSGSNLEEEQIVGMVNIRKSLLDRLHLKDITKLCVITAYGDSMSPTIESGSKCLCDTSRKGLEQGGVFIIKSFENMYLKRVIPTMGGQFKVSSDNPAIQITEDLQENAEIVGKVVFVWQGKTL